MSDQFDKDTEKSQWRKYSYQLIMLKKLFIHKEKNRRKKKFAQQAIAPYTLHHMKILSQINYIHKYKNKSYNL